MLKKSLLFVMFLLILSSVNAELKTLKVGGSITFEGVEITAGNFGAMQATLTINGETFTLKLKESKTIEDVQVTLESIMKNPIEPSFDLVAINVEKATVSAKKEETITAKEETKKSAVEEGKEYKVFADAPIKINNIEISLKSASGDDATILVDDEEHKALKGDTFESAGLTINVKLIKNEILDPNKDMVLLEIGGVKEVQKPVEEPKIVEEPIKEEEEQIKVVEEEKIEKEPEPCNGCMFNDKCIEVGTRVNNNGVRSFCDYSGIMLMNKDGEACKANYECDNQKCINGFCKKAKKGFFGWIASLFG